ncbi:hypothetical protein TRVA0_041S01024 [Trichomonascus vanleenenianus]|uniref:uncharacterized protein n=1 Tax=Trichomonascus vanleenenianus TaxID=2268995 RepID=UPI003EC9CE40
MPWFRQIGYSKEEIELFRDYLATYRDQYDLNNELWGLFEEDRVFTVADMKRVASCGRRSKPVLRAITAIFKEELDSGGDVRFLGRAFRASEVLTAVRHFGLFLRFANVVNFEKQHLGRLFIAEETGETDNLPIWDRHFINVFRVHKRLGEAVFRSLFETEDGNHPEFENVEISLDDQFSTSKLIDGFIQKVYTEEDFKSYARATEPISIEDPALEILLTLDGFYWNGSRPITKRLDVIASYIMENHVKAPGVPLEMLISDELRKRGMFPVDMHDHFRSCFMSSPNNEIGILAACGIYCYIAKKVGLNAWITTYQLKPYIRVGGQGSFVIVDAGREGKIRLPEEMVEVAQQIAIPPPPLSHAFFPININQLVDMLLMETQPWLSQARHLSRREKTVAGMGLMLLKSLIQSKTNSFKKVSKILLFARDQIYWEAVALEQMIKRYYGIVNEPSDEEPIVMRKTTLPHEHRYEIGDLVQVGQQYCVVKGYDSSLYYKLLGFNSVSYIAEARMTDASEHLHVFLTRSGLSLGEDFEGFINGKLVPNDKLRIEYGLGSKAKLRTQ